MKKTKVFLAGIGGYGGWYLHGLFNTDDSSFELAGVADPFASSSRRYEDLKAKGIPIYNTPDEFYAENSADLAIIASPIHTHDPYIRSCLKNGSYVLCEKPVTGSLQELDDLIEVEKKSGLFVAVGFQDCFSLDVLDLKKDILNGLFGKPLEFKLIRMNARGTKYYNRNGWASKLFFEGKAIMDSPLQNANAHDLQNMFFLLGDDMGKSVEIDSLKSELWKGHPQIENYNAAAVRIKTKKGVDIGFYTAHCVTGDMEGPLAEYHFEKAIVKWDNWDYKVFFKDGTTKVYSEGNRGKPFKKFYDTLEAARTGIPPVCTLETARTHTHCVELVQKFPIVDIAKDKLIVTNNEDGDSFYEIPGLNDAFFKAYEESKLPSEIGFGGMNE